MEAEGAGGRGGGGRGLAFPFQFVADNVDGFAFAECENQTCEDDQAK